MYYREKIIEFMKRKAGIISDHGVDPSLYFDTEDEREILLWHEHDARRIWENMKISFPNVNISYMGHICPFCRYSSEILFTTGCDSCPFGKNHGICDDENSDYRKIENMLGNMHEIFTAEIIFETQARIEQINFAEREYRRQRDAKRTV